MNQDTVTLVSVVYGAVYEWYAANLWATAGEHFWPAESDVRFLELPGDPGWPEASSHRYRVLLEHAAELAPGYVFLIDADMVFEAGVGDEILWDGIVAVEHPGHPDAGQLDAPWNAGVDPSMGAWTPDVPRDGVRYHPGAFVGGERGAFLRMATEIDAWIRVDEARGLAPRWYDEAYLNRYLAMNPPGRVLDVTYCAWRYQETPWRKIVHQDKTPAEFELRGAEDQAPALESRSAEVS